MSETIKASTEQIEEMLDYYEGYLSYNESPHIIARARLDKNTITFYTTNTVLFQGTESVIEYNIWAKKYNLPLLEHIESPTNIYEYTSAIGCDEVGTGDYFGPVVVCATYVNTEQIAELKRLGVKDSKLMTDNAIINLALKLKDLLTYSILVLPPEKYNSLQKTNQDNMNFIKAYLHNTAINSILKKLENVKYDAILIDEFTPREKYFEYLAKIPNVVQNITLIQKGERAHIGIAAASILARAAFLKEIRLLSDKYKIELMKGAGVQVDRQAVSLIRSFGFNELKNIAKIKFVNTDKVLNYFKENNIKIHD